MKLAVVGTSISLMYLPYFKEYGIELISLCATKRSHDKTIKLCEDYQIEHSYDDYDQMLEEGGFDTVYISVNNHLHYPFTKKALEKGYHCIVEKPFMANVSQTREMIELAREKKLFLFEFSRINYTGNYDFIREHLTDIGQIKSVIFSRGQYSRRYDAFRNGEILPVFNPEMAGGALMDLNVYSLHYVIGLFGKPVDSHYYPIVEKGIDINGMLILNYDGFNVLCSINKDADCRNIRQINGINGSIEEYDKGYSTTVEITIRNGQKTEYDRSEESDFMKGFIIFKKMVEANDHQLCEEYLQRTLTVSEIMTKARLDNGIIFPDDIIR